MHSCYLSSTYLQFGREDTSIALEGFMRVPEDIPSLCPRFHRASELIGRRWTGAILYLLLKARCRFATLRSAIPTITDRMLSERLQELEEEGIVERTVVPETPVRVEYALTKKGRQLMPAIDAIAEWAHQWIPREGTAPRKPEKARAPHSAQR
jgi:DNA-binding HxlR family transcriptional regulator